jgi:hypothetical protein
MDVSKFRRGVSSTLLPLIAELHTIPSIITGPPIFETSSDLSGGQWVFWEHIASSACDRFDLDVFVPTQPPPSPAFGRTQLIG